MNLKTRFCRPLAVMFWLALLTGHLPAAPYGAEGLQTEWTQPDGVRISLRVFGDEFYARTETLDGHTVVYDPADGSYRYAELSADRESLVPGATRAHLKAPAAVSKHLSLPPNVIRRKHAENFQKFAGDREQRWRARVQAVRKQRDIQAGLQPAPAAGDAEAAAAVEQEQILAAPVGGSKTGLTILVQFPDDPNTVTVDPVNFPTTQAKIERYCNEVGYADDGNSGSIRDYFADQSLNTVTYTQSVTQIVTLPHPRNYYNYSDYPANTTLQANGVAGRGIINDAIAALKSASFDFSTLSTDSSRSVIATNVLFAGPDSGVWPDGLWPHSWSMPYPGINVGTGINPKYIYRYQITNVETAAPAIGTFIHENGHLLLDYPDLYDYGGDSEGVGSHCLMGAGNHNNGGKTPAPLNAYFKDIVGWANVVDYTTTQVATISLPTTGNVARRIRKPGLETEYFIVENRGTGDKWANSVPDKGIAIWHIDELKTTNDEQQMTTDLHYEVSLEQADGAFDMENDRDRGDSLDLFEASDPDFTDLTLPNADWWSGTASGIRIKVTSPQGANMNVEFGDTLVPEIAVEQPVGTGLVDGVSALAFNVASLGGSMTQTVTVRNLGVGNLTGLAITKDGAQSGDFTIGALGATSLAAGASTTFDVTYTAGSSSSSAAVIHIASNDGDENSFDIALNATVGSTVEFGGGGFIAIPSSGSASPYPSTITVAGVVNSVVSVKVKLNGVNHARSNDLDILLVAPGGAVCALMSDAGGTGSISNANLVCDDAAASALPNSTITSGGYRPTDYTPGESLPPGGSGTIGTNLTALAAGGANGDWKLFVVDDRNSNSGSIQSWSLVIQSVVPLVPEIAVEQPVGTDLTDGAAVVGCGSLALGQSSGALGITLKNSGTANLSGLVVTKDGDHAADFTVGALGATTLAPGQATTFSVTFAPGAAGSRSAAVHIASNDANENPFDIALTGTGYSLQESWRMLHFNTALNSGNAADSADPDGDGFINLMEYAFKRHPMQADGNPVFGQQNGGSFSIFYPRNAAATDVGFAVEESADLGSGSSWVPAAVVEEILDTVDGVQQVRATRSSLPGEDRIFLRVRVRSSP